MMSLSQAERKLVPCKKKYKGKNKSLNEDITHQEPKQVKQYQSATSEG